MDIVSIISIVVVVIIAYCLIKIIPSLIRLVIGVISLLVVLYLLKYFFGIQLFDILIKYVNPANWGSGFNGVISLFNYFAGQVESFLRPLISKLPASGK